MSPEERIGQTVRVMQSAGVDQTEIATVLKIPKAQQHRWKELQGLGGGWTCVRCKKSASDCYGRERHYCSGAPAKKGAKK